MAIKRTRSVISTRHNGEVTQSPETQKIAANVAQICGDKSITESVEISTTLLTRVRQMMENGGTIITDTSVVMEELDKNLISSTKCEVRCFLESSEVKKLAERRMISRAEVAVDVALSVPGPKLMVIGSAPAALGRVLQRRAAEPMTDVYIVTAVNGFVSAVALKERLRESNMTYAVVRGKSGGLNVTAALTNSIMRFLKH